jgi:predicted dehydrogenase
MSGLRWGILGTGNIARSFTSDLNLVGARVQAVGSRRPESAEAFAHEFGAATAHGSYEELVADEEVDAIYVATPHPHHVEHATLALEHGKHVLVEKPFTINAAEAAAVVDLATERGLVVLEAMWTRFLPHMARIRELIAGGALGDVRALIADHDQKLPSDPSHRLQDPALGGGALLDLGIYPVSFAWDLFDEPDRVLAISNPTATGVDAQTSILLGFPGGQQAVIHTMLDGKGPGRAAIIGTDARIEIDPVWYKATSFRVIGSDDAVIETYESDVVGRGMHYEAAELERLVAEGHAVSPRMTSRQTVGVMRTLDAVREQIGLRYPSESPG